MADAATTYWWQRLTDGDGRPLPTSVGERLAWYQRQVRRHRTGNYLLETAIVVVAAAIPAAAGLGASVALTGVLGAVVTALAGLRQLIRPGENWIRFSGTLVAMQREAVVWSAGGSPYDRARPDVLLVENVEHLVAQEAARWTDQRAPRTSTSDAESPPT